LLELDGEASLGKDSRFPVLYASILRFESATSTTQAGWKFNPGIAEISYDSTGKISHIPSKKWQAFAKLSSLTAFKEKFTLVRRGQTQMKYVYHRISAKSNQLKNVILNLNKYEKN